MPWLAQHKQVLLILRAYSVVKYGSHFKQFLLNLFFDHFIYKESLIAPCPLHINVFVLFSFVIQ